MYKIDKRGGGVQKSFSWNIPKLETINNFLRFKMADDVVFNSVDHSKLVKLFVNNWLPMKCTLL